MTDPTTAAASGRPIDPAIAQQAAEWFDLFVARHDTPADRQQWREWRAADPEHERAWARLEAVHLHLERAPRPAVPTRGIYRFSRGRRAWGVALLILILAAGACAVPDTPLRAGIERLIREHLR